jgi:hypothetical protein
MKHLASDSFWAAYEKLPPDIRELADKNFALLKADLHHPSLRFKKVKKYWSVRIGLGHRALARKVGDDFRWHWIGSHEEYDRLIG